MFFDEIKLSRKSWHYKLMKFTWGKNTPNLWSFCPYFWLTIFNFLILPITLCVRSVQGFFNFLDRKLFIEPYEEFLVKKSDDVVFTGKLFEYNIDKDKLPRKSMFNKTSYYEAVDRLNAILAKKWGMDNDPNYFWTDEFQERKRELIRKYWEEEEKRRNARNEMEQKQWERSEAKRIKREESMKKLDQAFSKIFSPLTFIFKKISSVFSKIGNFFKKPDVYKIVKITKQTVSFVVVSAIILTASYYLFIFVRYLYTNVDFNWSWKFFFWGFYFGLKVIAFVWAVTGTVYFIWSILKKPVTNFFEWLVDLELPKTRAFFAFLSTIIVAPFVFLIIKPVQFFIMYFKAVKNENCPAIIWEEEK